jgi:hypothetical protein
MLSEELEDLEVREGPEEVELTLILMLRVLEDLTQAVEQDQTLI